MNENQAQVPVVSVVVLTYNHARFIAECLDSLLAQRTTFPFEIIIGEDDSSDGTRAICQAYAANHPETIRLLLHSRKDVIMVAGQPTGRNNLLQSLKAVKGRYVAYCEGDDYWTDPLKLQKQVDFLDAHPDYACSFHNAIVVDADSQPTGEALVPEERCTDLSAHDLMAGAHVVTPSLMYRMVIREFPPELYRSGVADLFITSLVGNHGKGKFQSEVGPSAYRRHAGGSWSMAGRYRRYLINMLTVWELRHYYKRMGKAAYARIYLKRFLEVNPTVYLNARQAGDHVRCRAILRQSIWACLVDLRPHWLWSWGTTILKVHYALLRGTLPEGGSAAQS